MEHNTLHLFIGRQRPSSTDTADTFLASINGPQTWLLQCLSVHILTVSTPPATTSNTTPTTS